MYTSKDIATWVIHVHYVCSKYKDKCCTSTMSLRQGAFEGENFLLYNTKCISCAIGIPYYSLHSIYNII